MRGNWSVRELKRQIGSLYFERSCLSLNKGKLAKIAHAGAEQIANAPEHPIRNQLIRLATDSPELFAVIKKEGRV